MVFFAFFPFVCGSTSLVAKLSDHKEKMGLVAVVEGSLEDQISLLLAEQNIFVYDIYIFGCRTIIGYILRRGSVSFLLFPG